MDGLKLLKHWYRSLVSFIRSLEPRHAKPTDANILRLLLPAAMGIVVCMICMAGMTWAWFSASIQSAPQTVTAANFDMEITVKTAGDTVTDVTPEADGSYSLQAGTYQVMLEATGSSQKGGYCVLKVGQNSYYTDHIYMDNPTMSFTLQIEDASVNCVFIAAWGTCSFEPSIVSGGAFTVPKTPENLVLESPDKEEGKQEPDHPVMADPTTTLTEEVVTTTGETAQTTTTAPTESTESAPDTTEDTTTAVTEETDTTAATDQTDETATGTGAGTGTEEATDTTLEAEQTTETHPAETDGVTENETSSEQTRTTIPAVPDKG